MTDKMIIVIIFPSFKNYPERLKLYCRMSEFSEVDKVYIYTRILPGNFNYKSAKVDIEVIEDKIKFYLRIKHIIKNRIKHKKNIVIINHFINLTFFLKRYRNKRNIKIITKFYFPNFLFFFKKNKNVKFKISEFFLLFKRSIWDFISLLFSDIIIGNSKEIENLVKKVAKTLHIKRKILTFPTPVDTDFFYRKDKIKESLNKNRLLFVGNLLVRKGIFDLLETAKILKDQNVKYKLVIIGSFILKKNRISVSEYVKRNKMENSVEFVGTVGKEELIDHYNKSDVFLFPSYYEGSPRVVKEAMACGLPVVSYDIEGIKLIDQDKEIIQMVKLSDVKELSVKVLELIHNREKLKSLSMEGEVYIRKNFSVDEIAKKELELLFELIKN